MTVNNTNNFPVGPPTPRDHAEPPVQRPPATLRGEPPTTVRGGPVVSSTAGTGSLESNGVVVELSQAAAQQLSELRSQLNGLPEIRQEQTQRLQSAIRNGTFQVSGRQLAEAMLSELITGRGASKP
jgi:flagellar biosynthesis anti-sigma factor FlgM